MSAGVVGLCALLTVVGLGQGPVEDPLEAAVRAHGRGAAASATTVAQALRREAARYDLPVSLLAAVAQVESGYNPVARSPAGAVGLMQLLPATARQVAASEGLPTPGSAALLDPEVSCRLGAAYLARERRARGSVAQALLAYLCGPACAAAGSPMAQRHPYVRGVLDRQARLARLLGEEPPLPSR